MGTEKVSEAVGMREAIGVVAGPFQGNRKSWLATAARHAGVSYRAAKALWYREITDPEHKAARRMTDAARRHGAIEAQGLADVFERAATAMRLTDPDFFGEDIVALVDVARTLRGKNRTGDDRAKRLGEGEGDAGE